jgi:tRNA (mo5U34)-methyltransferase
MPGPSQDAAREVQRRLDELLWYHTVDVMPGVTTRGWFDLRHALDLLPIPDLRGKRCLDIGTWDGFYAYEMERRGADEVVALDVADLAEVDYPPECRSDAAFDASRSANQDRSAGFHLLHEVLDSRVEWQGLSIYDLDQADIGSFDFVVVGSLLVHLRDPVRALDAVRRVTRGKFLSVDYIHASLNLMTRTRPLFELRGQGQDFQWWLASDPGLRHLLHVGGFTVEQSSKPFLLRPGPSPARKEERLTARARGHQLVSALTTRDATPGGHPHRGYLSRPRF